MWRGAGQDREGADSLHTSADGPEAAEGGDHYNSYNRGGYSEMNEEMIKSAESGPHRRGKNELLKHLRGEKITRTQAVKAKCYDCNGMGELNECHITDCPLLPYSPYRSKG